MHYKYIDTVLSKLNYRRIDFTLLNCNSLPRLKDFEIRFTRSHTSLPNRFVPRLPPFPCHVFSSSTTVYPNQVIIVILGKLISSIQLIEYTYKLI